LAHEVAFLEVNLLRVHGIRREKKARERWEGCDLEKNVVESAGGGLQEIAAERKEVSC
jgi:hypothetical protein